SGLSRRPRSHCAAKKASSVCLVAFSEVVGGADSAACRQATGMAAISAASSRCLSMEDSPERTSGSLARGALVPGYRRLGACAEKETTCRSGGSREPSRAILHHEKLAASAAPTGSVLTSREGGREPT